MAVVSSRQGLIDHCLRRLGYPVVEINVDDDQVEDRVDDTLQLYREFHSDGISRVYRVHQFTQAEIDQKYFDVSSDVLTVIKVLPIASSYTATRNFFDVKYQVMLNDFANMGNYLGDLAYYEQLHQYLSLLDNKLGGHPLVEFSRHKDTITWFSDMTDGDIVAGDYVAYEAYVTTDPETYSSVYNDMFVKNYLTQSIKQQWGTNMMKFEGMQLPGGVTINGRILFEEATSEMERLEEKMRLEYEFPPDFFVG